MPTLHRECGTLSDYYDEELQEFPNFVGARVGLTGPSSVDLKYDVLCL